jgi:predicted metalloendopeptidase
MWIHQSVAGRPVPALNGKWLTASGSRLTRVLRIVHLPVRRHPGQLRGIVDSLDGSGDAEARKIADLYASFMDEPARGIGTETSAGGICSDRRDLGQKEIPASSRICESIGAGAPMRCNQMPGILQYAVIVRQSGLGMPDQDYYSRMTPSSGHARQHRCTSAKYSAWRATMRNATPPIRNLETALAQVQWTRSKTATPSRPTTRPQSRNCRN